MLDALRASEACGKSRTVLRTLLARATEQEQQFVMALLVGELRQGALEGLMIEALAKAAGLSRIV